MADNIKNMSTNIIMPRGSSEELLRLDVDAAEILNRSGIMHAGVTKAGKGYKVRRYNVCKHHVFFIMSGKLYFINSGDEICAAGAGDRVIMPKSYQQCYWTQGKLDLCWFLLHPIGLWANLDAAIISSSKGCWIDEIYANVCGYIREGSSAYQDSSEVSGYYAGLICKYLEREINGEEIEPRVTEQERELEYLMCKVGQELAKRWTVQNLADIIYVSTAQLHRMVQSTYKATPMQLVREMRLAKARELLCNTEMSLSMISEEVGYESAFALSKAFKKHFNVTPADVKKKSGVEVS